MARRANARSVFTEFDICTRAETIASIFSAGFVGIVITKIRNHDAFLCVPSAGVLALSQVV